VCLCQCREQFKRHCLLLNVLTLHEFYLVIQDTVYIYEDRLSFVKTSLDVTYLYLYDKEHFNNLLKSSIFVQMNSMSWLFHFSNVDESELPAPVIQIPAAGRVKVDSEILT